MEILFILMMGVFVYIIIANIKRFIDNENSPIVTEKAYLRRKKSDSHMNADGCMHTTLLLEFDINGTIIKCTVPNRVYRQVREGTEGMLTHQGTRFKCFEVDGIRIEK